MIKDLVKKTVKAFSTTTFDLAQQDIESVFEGVSALERKAEHYEKMAKLYKEAVVKIRTGQPTAAQTTTQPDVPEQGPYFANLTNLEVAR